MQSFNHTFEEFPEGSWWIAWIDHVQSGAGQSPRVHVTLSRISRQGMSASDLRTKIIETQNILMTVSGLPLLAVGDGIENKRLVRVGNTSHVKSVCDFGSGGVTASFTFDAKTVPQSAGTRLGAERAVRPTFYTPGLSCPVLSTKEYKFPATRNCLCLVVTDGPRTFLIPAAELLRSFKPPSGA